MRDTIFFGIDFHKNKSVICALYQDGSEVHVKSLYSRNIKTLIVSREMVLRSKVNLMNHVRGTLKEYGILIPVGPKNFFKEAPQKIANLECTLIRETLEEILKTILTFVDKQKFIENQLKQHVLNNPQIALLQSIPGVGELGSCMAVAVIDDISRFKSAREFASYLGLTPRVHASADKRMMGSISKSGPEILRRYLIHGARAWMKYSPDKDPNRKWAEKVKERRGMNKATVALAHRMCRIMFAVLRDEVEYNGRKKKKREKMTTAA